MSRKIGVATLIWALSIFLSRVVGIAREAVIGRVLGGGEQASLYFISFTLPDFLNYLLAGGAFSVVFIPIIGKYLHSGDQPGAWDVLNRLASWLIVSLAIVLPALWWATPPISGFLAPGFSPAQLESLTSLTRIMLPAQAFHLLGGLLTGALLADDRHLIPALAPLVYTASVIVGGLVGGASYGASGFASGVLLGSFLGPFLLPLIGCLKRGYRFRFSLFPSHPDVSKYWIQLLPIMVAQSIVVVDDWILRRTASAIAPTAVATLQYAKQILHLPVGMLGFAAASAAYPTLTRLIYDNRPQDAFDLGLLSIRRIAVLSAVAQFALSFGGLFLSELIYGQKIPHFQHVQIALSLSIMCMSLWAWTTHSIAARCFYARGKTWPPSLLGTAVVPVAYPLYLYFGKHLGAPGLALASSVAIASYSTALVYFMHREFRRPFSPLLLFFSRLLLCTILGLSVGCAASSALPGAHVFWNRTVGLAVCLCVFFASGCALRMFRVSEFHSFLSRFKRVA